MSTKEKHLKDMTNEELEVEAEWVIEARHEGYTWKQLAKRYGVSIPTLKKTLGIKK